MSLLPTAEPPTRRHGPRLRLPRLALLLLLALAVAGCFPFGGGDKKRPRSRPRAARAKVEGHAPSRPSRAKAGKPRTSSPRSSQKDRGLLPYDAKRPCFTRREMTRARRALFRGRRGRGQERWLRALNRAFFEIKADCKDTHLLLLVLSLIQQESGVRVDPPLENRNLEKLLGFKLERLRKRSALAARLLGASGIEEALKAKLRRDNRRVKLRTEGDLVRYVEDDVKVWFKDYLNKNYSVPGPLAGLAAEIGITSPVTTIGPMQINADKAYRNARARKDGVASRSKMRALLLDKKTALARGLKEGVYLVWKSYRFYRAGLPRERAVYFAAVDYNSGEYSSRNAAFQERVAAVSGRRLLLDGDLLIYHNGQAQDLISNTEEAVKKILPRLKRAVIRKALLLEKDSAFSKTRIAKLVCRRYRSKAGGICRLARLPAGAGNETARIKMGRSYSPENYVRAFQARFRKNRRWFGEN